MNGRSYAGLQQLGGLALLVSILIITAGSTWASPNEAWTGLVQKGIEHDFQGDHDRADVVWDQLVALDPEDPEPYLRKIETAYWRHYYDETVDLRETGIRPLLDRLLELSGKGMEKDPNDLRSRMFLGEALIQEARYEGMSGNYLKAGSAGERGREHLEGVLAADPSMIDAKFSLGLYYYYASIAPQIFKYISWLWFVPKGDRELGLAYLRETMTGNGVYAANAEMVMTSIYSYHPPTDVEAAYSIVRKLHTQYPKNAIIHFELLEVLFKAHRYDELVAEAKSLELRHGESEWLSGRALLSRLWRARSAMQVGRLDEARVLAFSVDPADPNLPTWGVPWTYVIQAQTLDVNGERAEAKSAYKTTIEVTDKGGFHNRPARLAKAGLKRPFDPLTFENDPVMFPVD